MFENKCTDSHRKSTNLNKTPLNEILQEEEISRPDTLRNRSSSIIEKMEIFNNLGIHADISRNGLEEGRNSSISNKNKFSKIYDDKTQKYIWIENDKLKLDENKNELYSTDANISHIQLNTEIFSQNIESPSIKERIENIENIYENLENICENRENICENRENICENRENSENKNDDYNLCPLQTEKEQSKNDITDSRQDSYSKSYQAISDEKEIEQKEQKIQTFDLIKEKLNKKTKSKEQYNEVINTSLSNVTNPESVINISNFNVNHNNYNSIFHTLRSNQAPIVHNESKEGSHQLNSIIEVKSNQVSSLISSRNNKIYLGIITVLVFIILSFIINSMFK
jgi:hypothetical protein